MGKALVWAFGWLLKGAQVKFLIFSIIAVLFAALSTLLFPLISSFINPQNLTNYFNLLPASVWYFLDIINYKFGLPLIISAYIARFTIRRIPFIG